MRASRGGQTVENVMADESRRCGALAEGSTVDWSCSQVRAEHVISHHDLQHFPLGNKVLSSQPSMDPQSPPRLSNGWHFLDRRPKYHDHVKTTASRTSSAIVRQCPGNTVRGLSIYHHPTSGYYAERASFPHSGRWGFFRPEISPVYGANRLDFPFIILVSLLFENHW